MTFGSLFAGIGGFDLGFERAGMRCVWQVEIDPYCRRVLTKHWPDVPKWDDVRTFTGEGFEKADVICGGFPCQDISNAGKRGGIDGERSGLWSEYARIVRLLRPRYVVVENVAALLVRGIDRVLGDLAACGYDAEWDCVPAAAVGAPHRRDRLFIVAHARHDDEPERAWGPRREVGKRLTKRGFAGGDGQSGSVAEECGPADRGEDVADTELHRVQKRRRTSTACEGGGRPGRVLGNGSPGGQVEESESIPHAVFAGLEGHECGKLALADFRRHNADPAGSGWWSTEPDVGRVADGVPARMDRLKGLGNAVVPHVAEWIGRRLTSLEPGDDHA